MSKQKIELEVDVPEGHKIIGYRRAQQNEIILDTRTDGVYTAKVWTHSCDSAYLHIILEKVYVYKVPAFVPAKWWFVMDSNGTCWMSEDRPTRGSRTWDWDVHQLHLCLKSMVFDRPTCDWKDACFQQVDVYETGGRITDQPEHPRDFTVEPGVSRRVHPEGWTLNTGTRPDVGDQKVYVWFWGNDKPWDFKSHAEDCEWSLDDENPIHCWRLAKVEPAETFACDRLGRPVAKPVVRGLDWKKNFGMHPRTGDRQIEVWLIGEDEPLGHTTTAQCWHWKLTCSNPIEYWRIAKDQPDTTHHRVSPLEWMPNRGSKPDTCRDVEVWLEGEDEPEHEARAPEEWNWKLDAIGSIDRWRYALAKQLDSLAPNPNKVEEPAEHGWNTNFGLEPLGTDNKDIEVWLAGANNPHKSLKRANSWNWRLTCSAPIKLWRIASVQR